MPKVSPQQTSFNGGEFSELVYGRTDSERYKTGLAVCKNYLPTLQGPVIRRPGSKFIAEISGTDGEYKVRQIPFKFSTTQAYVIEAGFQYFRFYKDNALITLTAQNITGATAANPVVITCAGHGYSNGDYVVITGVGGMVELNNRQFQVRNVTANTFTLDYADGSGDDVNGTAFTAYTSGGSVAKVYEIASPYLDTDVFDIKFTQSADVLYLAHPSYAPRKLTRTGHTSWTLTTIDFLDGPYLDENTTSTTLTPTAFAVGTGVTLTASSVTGINNNTGFQSTDVGRLIRMKQGSIWGYVKITGWTSTTVVTVEILKTLTTIDAKTAWRMGIFSATYGYPTCIMFHESRLWLGGAGASPQSISGSRLNNFENFAQTDTDGVVTASHACVFTLDSNDVNAVKWIASDEKGLQAGTGESEWCISRGSQTESLHQTNVKVTPASTWGSSNVQPVQAGKSTLFVQSSKRHLREMRYFYDVDGFSAEDMTQIAEHITGDGITQLALQRKPQTFIWAVREDGALLSMTYERSQDAFKVGWARHILGGTGDPYGGDPKVQSVAVIPSPNGTLDHVWLVVLRYVNGRYFRSIEYLDSVFTSRDEQKEAFCLDSGLSLDNQVSFNIFAGIAANPIEINTLVSGAHGLATGDRVIIRSIQGSHFEAIEGLTYTITVTSATTFTLDGTTFGDDATILGAGTYNKIVSSISGYNHLEGETVSILADGAQQPNQVVTGGRITLSPSAAVVQVGYPYNSDLQLLRIDAGAADGTAQGKTRRTHRIGILLARTLGLKYGMSFDRLDTINFRTASMPIDQAVPLYSGIKSMTIESTYDFENQICFRQDTPFPGTISAVYPQMVTQDR